MMRPDAYDPQVAFDDLMGATLGPRGQTDLVHAAHAMMLQAARRRAGSRPDYEVVGADYDTTAHTFQVLDGGVVLGGAAADMPLYEAVKKSFVFDIGEPKLVRADTEESYAEFRAARRAPYIARLEERLARLEQEVASHVADQHGGGRVAALEERLQRHLEGSDDDIQVPVVGYVPFGPPTGQDLDLSMLDEMQWSPAYEEMFEGEDVEGASGMTMGAFVTAARGGHRVPLLLPPGLSRRVEAWQDADEVLVTVHLPGGLRITSGAPLEPHIEEMLGAAQRAGVDPEATLTLVPALAPQAAGDHLTETLVRASGPLSRLRRAPSVAMLQPRGDAEVAAVMTLIQSAQRGDRRAAREVLRLQGSGRKQRRLVEDTARRLTRAQREKAHRRSR